MKNLLIILLLGSLMAACQNNLNKGPEKSIDEIKSLGQINNADIIRNPVTANEPQDTVNVAKIAFAETAFDFGEVKEGEVVTHTFSFTNTGKVPLLISNARSTCGCTVPSWPKEPIPPGEGGVLEVRFNTKNKKNKQSKPVTITANTYPATTKVYLNGFVKASEEESVDKTLKK